MEGGVGGGARTLGKYVEGQGVSEGATCQDGRGKDKGNKPVTHDVNQMEDSQWGVRMMTLNRRAGIEVEGAKGWRRRKEGGRRAGGKSVVSAGLPFSHRPSNEVVATFSKNFPRRVAGPRAGPGNPRCHPGKRGRVK